MRINLGISVIGEDNKAPNYYFHLNRADVAKRITNHPSIDPWTKEFLLKRMSQYPDNALVHFVSNINEIVVAAINERSRFKKEEENGRKKSRENESGSEAEISGTTSRNGFEEA